MHSRAKLGDREVELDVVSQDQYDRLVAVVGLDDENVNAWLVQQGYAWAYREYTKDKNYCAWEAEARSAHRGLWALPAAQRHAPWEFRICAAWTGRRLHQLFERDSRAVRRRDAQEAGAGFRIGALGSWCRRIAAARSRATSAAAARFITCLAATRTIGRRSTSRRVNGGSVRKKRHARRGGGHGNGK